MSLPEFITLNDETLSVPQWARRLNMSTNAIRYRLKAGWPLKDALTSSARGRGSSAFTDGAKMQRRRSERQHRAQAAKLRREFSKLVFELDNALRTFREKLDTLLPDDDTGGWVDQPEKSPSDRTYHIAEECRKLEIS